MSYHHREADRVRRAGPANGENWFRVKFFGAVDSKHLNITPDQMDRVTAVFGGTIQAQHLASAHIGTTVTFTWRDESFTGTLRWFTHASDGVMIAIEENADDGPVEYDLSPSAVVKVHDDEADN